MALGIRARSEESLLFAGPQRDPNRASWLHAQRLQDAQRFHDGGHAVGVVRGARGGVPRIEVTAGHHHFVGDGGIDSADFGNHVVRVAIGLVKARLDIDRQLDGDPVFEQPGNEVVVFGRQHHRRDRVGAAVAAGDEDGPVLADIGFERDANAFTA